MLCLLLMDDHKVDDLHILCIKLKNLTELVQRILELWRIFASIYSDFEKAFLCVQVILFVLRDGCVGRRQSGQSFLKSSSSSLVLLGAICSNMSGAGKSEMSSFVFLYIVLAAINKTKGHVCISPLKCVSSLKGIQSPVKVINSSVNSHILYLQPVNESRHYLSFYMNISIENKTHRRRRQKFRM